VLHTIGSLSPVPVKRSDSRPALLTAVTALVAGLSLGMGAPASAQKALFLAKEVPQERFILVAAPIGSGERAQLNIYEQLNDRRPCFSTAGANPAIVNPLLGTFDFTGICNRFIDANGYSLRIGEDDLATRYRLSVIREKADTVLLAIPLKADYGPELLVARTQGIAPGFLQLVFEPGWTLKRRHFGPRPLGHVYIFRDATADTATTPKPAAIPAAQAAPPVVPATAPRPSAPAPAATPAAQAAPSAAPTTAPRPSAPQPTVAPAARVNPPAAAVPPTSRPSAAVGTAPAAPATAPLPKLPGASTAVPQSKSSVPAAGPAGTAKAGAAQGATAVAVPR
jgi:hypothetical protein